MIGRTNRLAVRLAVACLATFGIGGSALRAADVLLNGGLELGAGPDKWTLIQVTASTNAPGDFNGNGIVDAGDYVVWRKSDNTPSNYTLFRSNFGNTGGAGGGQFAAASEQLDDAQEGFPPATGLGLLVKPYAGNVGAFQDLNKPVNLTLTQTFPQGISAAGHTFYFTGDSSFQSGYSGNIPNLFADAPSGPIASPTHTKYVMEFLDAGNTVLGTAFEQELPRNRTDADPRTWVPTTVSGLAPANTTQIRVSVVATNMVASCSTACVAGQDVRFDNFSLSQDSPTGFNKLATRNGNLDTPGAPTNWSLVTVGNDAAAFAHDTFAIHSGQTGFWLRAFQGANGTTNTGPIDGKIVQTGAATAGSSYSLSAWAKLQVAYSGLDPTSGTQTFLKLEFLDVGGTPLSTASLDLGPNGPLGPSFWPADGPLGEGQGDWMQVSVPTAVAPAGTVSFRVSAGATGMIKEPFSKPMSALFDDFSLTIPGSGAGNLLGGAFASVPEPATCWLMLVASAWAIGIRRRGR